MILPPPPASPLPLPLAMTGPLLADWAMANTNSDSARAGAVAAINFVGNLGGIASCWTYLPRDAPKYQPPNLGNTLVVCIALCTIVALAVYLRRQNAIKAAGHHDEWIRGLDAAQQEALAHHHPHFRYRY